VSSLPGSTEPDGRGPAWDELASSLGVRAVRDGDPTRWYDELWSAGERGEVGVPWDRRDAHDLLAGWLAERAAGRDAVGRRAVVVGCGLGADAELLAARGFATTAFDISPAAVRLAQRRSGGSLVDYRVADLLDLPADMVEAHDLVVEIYTIQALHPTVRAPAIEGLRRLVAPGGTLFVVQIVREDDEPLTDEPPWLLDRAEMEAFAGAGLDTVSLHRVPNAPHPDARDRWRMVLHRHETGGDS
jgi:SAM-dependent methyltransferase